MVSDGFPFRKRIVGFVVLKLELGNRWRLFPVDVMMDHILFVGLNHSVSLPADGLDRFDPNYIILCRILSSG